LFVLKHSKDSCCSPRRLSKFTGVAAVNGDSRTDAFVWVNVCMWAANGLYESQCSVGVL